MPEFLDPVRYLGNMANHQKMYDFERDILRVKNPLSTDFEFIYDGLPIVVPAGKTMDMERYLVRRYIWNMIEHIYNLFAAPKMEQAKENFLKTHPDVLEDPYVVNVQVYDKIKRADDPEFQRKVIADCIIGVVKKHGSDRQLPKKLQNGSLDPNNPLYQTLIDDFKTVTSSNQESVSQQPVASTQQPTSQLG